MYIFLTTAEIKGHRRTYIGAMPGKPVQILKTVGTSNPVILIDEIGNRIVEILWLFLILFSSDKLGRGYQGDPASALLELLDSSQNNSFVDHFLDIPIDFSRTLFICTANDEGAIPGPLRDRMDIIRLSGYDIPEKVEIARRYLIPKIFKAMGLWAADVEDDKAEDRVVRSAIVESDVSKEALEVLIRNYCRESGIRSLEKHIEKIARKIAFQEVSRRESEAAQANGSDAKGDVSSSATSEKSNDAEVANNGGPVSYLITPACLEEYLGPPKYPEEALYSSKEGLPVGVVMGLAWNPQGGSPVFIEAVATPVAFSDSGGSVQMMTGQLGDVMKESVNIAYTYARQFVRMTHPSNDFFQRHQLHLHCPEGAVGKDGPSAGILISDRPSL